MTPTAQSTFRPSRTTLLRIGCLIVMLACNCCVLRRPHLRAQFKHPNGLRVGTGVYLETKEHELRLVGEVTELTKLPDSAPSNQDMQSNPQIEVVLTLKTVIEGQPWFQLIRTDSSVRKSSTLDVSRLKIDTYLIISAGTEIGQPIKENSLLHSADDFSITETDDEDDSKSY